MCLTHAESTPAEGTGQPGTSVGCPVSHEWAVRAVMGCGGWRRCGAPGLARTSYLDVCCPVASKDLARVRPSLLHGSRGINARPGRRSGARGLFEGPHLRNRLRLAWMAGEGGRVRRTGPAGGPGPAQDPRSPVHAASPALRWTGRAGAGARWWVYSDGRCERAEARRASMAVRCA